MQRFELMDHEQEQLVELLREKLHAETYLALSVPAETEHGYRARMCIRLLEIVQPRTPDRNDRDYPKAAPFMPASMEDATLGLSNPPIPVTT